MSIDIEQLRDYWDANMAEWDEDRAAHIHGSLPELLDELERWRCATYSATPDALSEDVANSVLEHVEVMSELERLRRLEAAVLACRDLSEWCISKCPACIDALSYCEAHTPECLRSVEAEDAAIAEARKAGEREQT